MPDIIPEPAHQPSMISCRGIVRRRVILAEGVCVWKGRHGLPHRHCERSEAIQSRTGGPGLLREACHRAALCADPLARNDGGVMAGLKFPNTDAATPVRPSARRTCP